MSDDTYWWENIWKPSEQVQGRALSNRMRDRTYDITIGMNGDLHGRIILVCPVHGPFSHMLDPLPPGHLWEGKPICPACRASESSP